MSLWTTAASGLAGIGPLKTSGQPCWEMKTTRPSPTAVTVASIAIEALRILTNSPSPARLDPETC